MRDQGRKSEKASKPGDDAKNQQNWFGWSHACAYLLAVTLLCYGSALANGRTFLPSDLVLLIPPWSRHGAEIAPNWHSVARPVWDPLFQFYPARKFLAQAIHGGFVPWHDPYIYSGTPFIGDGQSAFFYPINWLFAVLPLASAFGVVATLHTFLTGIFFTMFMRRRGCGWEASLVGATTWMLCGTLVAWQMWQVIDSTLCWVPLALYCADVCCNPLAPKGGSAFDRKSWLSFAGLCVSFGMILIAGHEQFAVYGVVVVVAYILVSNTRPLLTRIAVVFGSVAISGLIAAVQILPTLDMLHNSLRGQNSVGDLITTALPVSHLALLFMPEILGGVRDWQNHGYMGSVNYWEVTSYIGSAAAVLAAFAFYKPDSDRKRQLWLWSGIGIVGLLVGCGSPLYNAIYYIFPIVKSFHGLSRTLILLELSISVLASYGLQTAIDTERTQVSFRFFGRAALGVGLLSLALYGIAASKTSPVIAQTLTHDWLTYGLLQLSRALILIAVAWIAAVALSKKLRWLTVIVVAIDMLTFASGLSPGSNASYLYPKIDASNAMLQAAGSGRVVCLGGQRPLDRMIPNSAESVGLQDVSGSDPLMLSNYEKFIDALNTQSAGAPAPAGAGIVAVGGSPALNYLNVTAVISPEPLSINSYTPVYSGADAYVYTNTLAKGEVWVEHGASGSGSTKKDADFTSLLTVAPTYATPTPDLIGKIDAQCETVDAQVDPGSPGNVVFSEVYDPSWKCFVDGRQTTIIEAHGLLVAVPIVQGNHEVSLKYLPQSGVVGLYLTCVGWLILSWIVAMNAGDKKSENSMA